MPNWCWNNLRVEPTNTLFKSREAKAQLKKFISDVRDDGESVTLKDAKVYRENFIANNFENIYRNDTDKFVKHSEMPVKKFMQEVLYFSYEKDTKVFRKDQEDFSMQQILPVPIEYTQEYKSEEGKKREKELKKKYGYKDWYDWNVGMWGTKWNVSDVSFDEQEDGSVTYGYNTAWAPNGDFLINICKQYPLLDFTLEYEEEGCDFEGELEIIAGEVVKNETRPFSNHSCNGCGERQDDLDEGETINDDGLCPTCQKEEDENE